MIFVTLGNQNFQFHRLLEKVEDLIRSNYIKEEVKAQIGHTVFKSNLIHTIDFLSKEEFDQYIDEASIVISHSGTGSLKTALRKGKKVIAAARLKKYKEHIDDHQQEILEAFSKRRFILSLNNDLSDLDKKIADIQNFKPKTFYSNNELFNKNLLKIIEEL